MRVDLQGHGPVERTAPRAEPVGVTTSQPASRPTVRLIGRPLFASHRGHIIARTISGLALEMPAGAPIYFFPRPDVRLDLLGPSPTMGLFDECGVATYYDVVLPGSIIIDGAMSFAMPDPELAELVDHIGFDAGNAKGCEVTFG